MASSAAKAANAAAGPVNAATTEKARPRAGSVATMKQAHSTEENIASNVMDDWQRLENPPRAICRPKSDTDTDEVGSMCSSADETARNRNTQ